MARGEAVDGNHHTRNKTFPVATMGSELFCVLISQGSTELQARRRSSLSFTITIKICSQN